MLTTQARSAWFAHLLLCGSPVFAQDGLYQFQEYAATVASSQKRAPLADNAFGERVSLFNGSTEFVGVRADRSRTPGKVPEGLTMPKMREASAMHSKIRQIAAIPDSEAHMIVLLEDYIRSNPQDSQSVVAYADALRAVGRSQEAVGFFKAALDSAKKNTSRSFLAVRIAMALEATSRPDAEHWYAQAAEYDKSLEGWAWELRGANLARLERFNAAIECYGRALKSKDVDRDEVLRNLALTYRALGDYETAAAYAKRALATAPCDKPLKSLRAGLENLEATRRWATGLEEE